MRFFEFDGSDSLQAKIIATTDQLKTDVENGKFIAGMTTDDLLKYYRQYGVTLDRTDLYSMIQNPPMKTFIKNIQGDQVVFKGQEPEGSMKPDENQKIVSQMAKKAAGKK